MDHARKHRIVREQRASARRLLQAAVVACGAAAVGGINGWYGDAARGAGPREAAILPTVHPTLMPTSAIPVPLIVGGDHTSVWKADLEQRMLVTGNARIDLGYRSLRANQAAIWLTPSREAGEATWDVAIYLSGNVRVLEGGRTAGTSTTGEELLVTTRVSRSIELVGTPTSKAEEEDAIVRRGDALRQELLHQPPQLMHIPQITITSTEEALQAGWIARGPDNRIVAGPGDFKLARGPDGRLIPVGPNAPKPAKPRPQLLAAGDEVRARQVGNEIIAVIPNPFLLYDALDGKPAIEMHAQRMVTFSPSQHEAGSTTAPAAAAGPLGKNMTQYITGVYLEGDVTINAGTETIHANRIYYDFTSQRAIMLESTLYTEDEKRQVPLYMRASEIRQIARGEYAAKKASFSTSEFHTPHYNIGAQSIYLQNITPAAETTAAAQPFDAPKAGAAPQSYAFKAKDTTLQVQGIPIFYFPYISGDTSDTDIPLRKLNISNSKTYGLSLETGWNLFALAGQPQPKNFHADLNLDYFSKRGPAGGVDATWKGEDYTGLFRSYVLEDRGQDRLGANRTNVDVLSDERGRVLGRHQQDLGDGWTLNLEATYISDPNFLQQFFTSEFDSDKEHETSFYLKHQDDTSAISFLGKFNFLDFTTVADQVDDQFTTEKRPEVKYWRLGDSFLDLFTYYSESGIANLHSNFTNYTPAQLSLSPTFLGWPAAAFATDPLVTFRQAYLARGWTDNDVLRGDTRQELDMPLSIGDLKIAPYVTGRVTAWDDAFPEEKSGDTTRLWGSAGLRSSMEFYRVYSDIDSTFYNVHQLRHVIEPQFNVFATGSDESRNDLQPFDRDVEGISKASGLSLSVDQKWQTKRGGPGHWRNVDWITLNLQWNRFFDRDRPDNLNNANSALFFPQSPLRGFYFPSRPELSLVQNSLAMDGTWRIGERTRFLGEANYNTDTSRLEQFAAGFAVDQTNTLSYFFGNRYVRALHTDEFTIAGDYQLSQRYELVASESYDFGLSKNILSSFTVIRKMPRFNMAVTATYDADNADTTFSFSASPEGFPELGAGTNTREASGGR